MPPLHWFGSGPVVPEHQSRLLLRPEFGAGAGYAGREPERSMKPRTYVVAPLLIQYGLWSALEACAVVPFYWGSSPQKFVDRLATPPREYAATVTGADIGDVAAALRWRAWRTDDEAWAFVLGAGAVMPLGSNAWKDYPQYTYVRTVPDAPDLAVGEGVWKLLVSLGQSYATDDYRIDALVGYLSGSSLRATAVELSSLHEINVRQPSSLVARLRSETAVGEGLWLTGRLEGYSSWGGRITAGGLLASEPGSVERILDSYVNLAGNASGAWAGAGVRWEATEESSLGVEVAAPVLADGSYRYWRAGAVVTHVLKQ